MCPTRITRQCVRVADCARAVSQRAETEKREQRTENENKVITEIDCSLFWGREHFAMSYDLDYPTPQPADSFDFKHILYAKANGRFDSLQTSDNRGKFSANICATNARRLN